LISRGFIKKLLPVVGRFDPPPAASRITHALVPLPPALHVA
jgi:hypothetical protein